MLRIGWVHRFARSLKSGWHIEWTTPGLQRVMLLGDLVDALSLCDDDRGPMAYDVFVRGGSFLDATFVAPRNSAAEALWIECVDALQLHGDVDGLLVFAHIVKGCRPDSGKEIVILPPEDE
jgi:hypothetical protein